MSDLPELLKILPIDQIATQLGISKEEAAAAAEEGGEAILAGLELNASTPQGAESLESALKEHELTDDQLSIESIDVEDGDKILGHVFDGKEDQVVAGLAGTAGGSGINFAKLLPMIAPAVMAMLARKSAASTRSTSTKSSGLDLGSIIGGMLGGGKSSGKGGGLDLGGLLGSILGGGRK